MYAGRNSPWVADRRVASGQRQVFQVGGPPKPGIAAHQPLAAPNRPVQAVAGAVQRHADDRPVARGPAVVGQAGGDVGVVVLHPHHRPAWDGVVQRKARGGIVRVQVTGHLLRFEAEKVFVQGQRGFQVFHVSRFSMSPMCWLTKA